MSGWSSGGRGSLATLLQHITLTLLALGVLAACRPTGQQALLDDYLARIRRVTEAEVGLPAPEPLPAYPPRRELTLEIPRRTIDVMEFFELHGCDMGALVGFRNSPLGRLQSASQRLGYETAWLEAASRCATEAEAQAWLSEMGAAKRAALPALFWNATFAAEEMRVALGTAAPAAGGDLADILRGLSDSLVAVEQGGFEVVELERLLGRLRQGSWLGPARRDWAGWRRYLAATSKALRESLPAICRNRQPTPRARRLEQVFLKLYVQQIQPALAADMSRQRAWVTELADLSGRLEAVRPATFQPWFDAVLAPEAADSEWSRTRHAVVDHVEAWQAVFAQCRIEPVPGLGQD